MSEHAWILDNLETYSAGGLEPDERERFEQHLADCRACTEAFAQSRTLDQHLESLFTSARPEAGLEDRMIRRLRLSRHRPWYMRKFVMGAAAVVGIGVVGAQASYMISEGNLPFPARTSSFWSLLTGREDAYAGRMQVVMFDDSGSMTVRSDPSSSMQDAEQMAKAAGEETLARLGAVESEKSDERLSPELLNAFGYYPPARSLVTKGTSRSHAETGGGQASSSLGTVTASANSGKVLYPPLNNGSLQSEFVYDAAKNEKGTSRIHSRKFGGGAGPETQTATLGDEATKLGLKSHSLGGEARSETKTPQVDTGGNQFFQRAATATGPAFPAGEAKVAEKDAKEVRLNDLQAKIAVAEAGAAPQMQGAPVPSFFTPTQQLAERPPQRVGEARIAGNELTPELAMQKPSAQAQGEQKAAKPSDEPSLQLEPPGAARTFRLDSDQEMARRMKEEAQATTPDSPKPNTKLPPPSTDGSLADIANSVKETQTGSLMFGVGAKGGTSPAAGGQTVETQPQKQQQAPLGRKLIIRTGNIEFEIQSFDAAVATITRLVNDIKGGCVDTVNSEKLPNGKVRGTVVVRVPPERLDSLLLDLRSQLGKGGELKSLRVGSEDITKQYTDMESRLRAARTMEERLLQVIKSGKGEIKDLVQAEKELGVWRTKIEEIEGELRYYSNLVSLSTLTITLYEREIKSPYSIVETERVQMGIEVEDVDQAQRKVVAAVTEAKGRVTKSELKQHDAGQLSAIIHFEVAPDAAGPLRDRLRQLGIVTRLEVDRKQQTEGGTGTVENIKTKRNDTQFFLSLYNVANVAPRETMQISLVCGDTEAVYRQILSRVQKASGRVVTSNLNRQRGSDTSGTIQFEVKSDQADALLQELKSTAELMRLQLTENPDAQNVTRSKRGFLVQLWAFGQVQPRETRVLQVATRDVPGGFRTLQEAVAKAKGLVLNAQLNEQNKQNITAQLDFDSHVVDQAGLNTALTQVGDVLSNTSTRAPEGENVLDSKVRWQVTLVNQANIAPREQVTLGIEVTDVDKTQAVLSELAAAAGGRTTEAQVAHERSGRVTAKLSYNVPLAAKEGLIDKFKNAGIVRVQQSTRNPQVPESTLALARIDVTLSNADLIVPSDDGLWPQIRKGLSASFVALSWSLTVVIVGLCFVLPWTLAAYAGLRVVRRLRGVAPERGT